jgi:hypothetical protein
MSEGRRGGERRRACATKHMHPTQAREIVACARETRPSLGPSTRARQSSLCTLRKRGGGALELASRLGKPAQAGGTSTGASLADVARLATCHSSTQVEGRGTQEKEGGRGLRPCEDQEPRLGCSHVDVTLQKSVGGVWPRISSANALQKERSGSSERGPSSERRSAGETVGRRVERRARREVGLTAKERARTGARPRVARECHSAVTTSPKAVAWSWDRGGNRHRILRRVPADGRHPGSSRDVVFHEPAFKVVLAVSRILQPVFRGQKPKAR